MKVAITPGFSELIIIVNPAGKVTREGLLTINMPWLYAPWPDAREKGVIEAEVEGETLRALLTALTEAYKKAGVDFEPINPELMTWTRIMMSLSMTRIMSVSPTASVQNLRTATE
jgi:pentose-5-phosphate-3-epimerase